MIHRFERSIMGLYETMELFLQNEHSQEDNKTIADMLLRELDKINYYDVGMLLCNLAIYRGHDLQPKTVKFIDWVIKRLKDIITNKITLAEFFIDWDKHYEIIYKNMTECESLFDRLHIANVVLDVNKLKKGD